MSNVTDNLSTSGLAQDSYEIRTGVASTDCQRVLDVWQLAQLGPHSDDGSDQAHFLWFYVHNPQGLGQTSFLNHISQPTPIGFLGVGARRFYLGREALNAGVLVDFVVAPLHRSAYPALKLQRSGRSDALRHLDFLYGMPSLQAVAICKRLPHQCVFDFIRFARVIRSQSYLRRHLPRWLATSVGAWSDVLDGMWLKIRLLFTQQKGQWITGFDARFDALWLTRREQASMLGVRDRAFLEWRFGQHPNHRYRTFVVVRPGSDAIVTYFICEQVGSTLAIMDMLSNGTDGEFTEGLLLLVREARKLGASSLSIKVAANLEVQSTLLKAQFSVRSRRPVFCMIGESMRERLKNAHFYITQADGDM